MTVEFVVSAAFGFSRKTRSGNIVTSGGSAKRQHAIWDEVSEPHSKPALL